MITLSIDEKDKQTLRITASYLLALAGDIHTEVTGDDGKALIKKGIVQSLQVANELVADLRQTVDSVFNVSELSEAEHLAVNKGTASDLSTGYTPNAAVIFGGKPTDAPYIAGVEASTTAPVVTTGTVPPTVELPPVLTPEVAASIVVPPSTAHASGVELDARGLPWDSRIHSREKTKIANGNWKNKRGVDPDTITDIEAELHGVMSIPSPAAVIAPPPPLVPAEVVIAPPNTSVAPPPPATIAPPASHSELPFPALMTKVAAAIAGQKLTQAQAVAIAQANGVQSLPLLIQRPDLIPAIAAAIDAQIAANAGVTV